MNNSYGFLLSGIRPGPSAAMRGGGRYYEHRAKAMAVASSGLAAAALPEIGASWALDRRTVVDQATDVAWVNLLSGNPRRALAALGLGIRGQERLPAHARELLGECVALEPALTGRALLTCIAGGTPVDRLRAVAAVLRSFLRPALMS